MYPQKGRRQKKEIIDSQTTVGTRASVESSNDLKQCCDTVIGTAS